jgi:hypothetical protein
VQSQGRGANGMQTALTQYILTCRTRREARCPLPDLAGAALQRTPPGRRKPPVEAHERLYSRRRLGGAFGKRWSSNLREYLGIKEASTRPRDRAERQVSPPGLADLSAGASSLPAARDGSRSSQTASYAETGREPATPGGQAGRERRFNGRAKAELPPTSRRVQGRRSLCGSGVCQDQLHLDLAAMDQAVDERNDAGGVWEDVGPLGEGLVGGKARRA